MKVVKQTKGARVTDSSYHASVPAFYEPRIKGTKTIGNETFYVGTNGKLYRRHLFDAMFRIKRTPVKHYTYKGTNPNMMLQD